MRWLENKEHLQDWRLKDEWTPLQAACLLSDVCPPPDGTEDLSNAGLEYEPEISFFSDKEVSYFKEKTSQVMELKASIISNYESPPVF